MKLFILLAPILLLFSTGNCERKTGEGKYKGRLEIKGICSNYTIKLLEGYIDTALVAATWTNEVTNLSYTKVFALGNPCSFPATIREGDEFYFSIETSTKEDCMVCMAYYPKPSRKLSIKVLDK